MKFFSRVRLPKRGHNNKLFIIATSSNEFANSEEKKYTVINCVTVYKLNLTVFSA